MKWEAVGLPDGVTFECPEFMASDLRFWFFFIIKENGGQAGLIELSLFLWKREFI